MASSTLPSSPRAPRWALTLLTVAACAWALGALYSLRWSPEIAFFRRGDDRKQDWARQLRQQHTNLVVIFGGSSCGTSIDGRRLLERHGLPVLNLGLGAGMGARVLTRYALESVQPGDTLLVALEPDLLAGPVGLEPLGVQFALATGRPELLREGAFVHWPSVLLDLRPGGQHALAMAGKFLGRQPLYRYDRSEWQPDGHHQVASQRPIPSPSLAPLRLSADGQTSLVFLRDACRERRVRVACVLPWNYCPPELLTAWHRVLLVFLNDVAEFLPVLKEPSLGAHTVREHFADTALHPTATGAALRSDELAASLADWTVWNREELAAAIAASPTR